MESVDSMFAGGKSLDDRDTPTFFTRAQRKYSRWPSLAKIKELKAKLDVSEKSVMLK